jgi:Na+-driven multidrug efflux pump
MVYIPMLFVLGSLFGADGLVWAQPAADLVSFAVGIVMYVLTWRKMTGTEKSLMQAQS